MNLIKLLLMAFSSLIHHKLRAFLTMLGIIFGVAAVVAMLAITEGAKIETLNKIKNMGIYNVLLKSVKPTENLQDMKDWVLRYGLTQSDKDYLLSVVPGVQEIVAAKELNLSIKKDGKDLDIVANSVEENYFKIAKVQISSGRFFNKIDSKNSKKVCVLGHDASRKLFNYLNPLGKSVKIGKEWFTVIGLMEKQVKQTTEGLSVSQINNTIYLPFSTANTSFGTMSIKRVAGSFSATDIEISDLIIVFSPLTNTMNMEKLIDKILKKRHKQNDYTITVPLSLLEDAKEKERLYEIISASIAGISLLVGGIGVMNIMLATVLERTKEIGIRRAIGATRADIIVQFLVECMTLANTGGVIGLALGLGIAETIKQTTGMPTEVTMWSMMLAFIISSLTGIIFGVYPAIRAANMRPVEALRHTG